MERGRPALILRALGNAALALSCIAAFALVWTSEHLGDGARRLLSFGVSMSFVVLFHEASDSWRRLGNALRNGEGHV